MGEITGGCLCGQVRYRVVKPLKAFDLCQGERWRTYTGSDNEYNSGNGPDGWEVL